MTPPRLVVVGASSGGVEAFTKLLTGLPGDFPAAVLLVLHVGADSPPVLPRILARASALPVFLARDGETIRACRVYVAPPDLHLLVSGERLALARGPREHGHRPAIDPLFRSAARSHGPRVIGVVLTGNLDDGVAGLATIADLGGVTVVQSPEDASFPDMPRAALERVAVDHVLPLAEIAPRLARLAAHAQPKETHATMPERDRPRGRELAGADVVDEVAMDSTASVDAGATVNEALGGRPSGYGCPECNGALWEFETDAGMRYRCRIGHAFGEAAMAHAQAEALEAAMWSALVALEESASVSRRMADRARSRGRLPFAQKLDERTQALLEHARVVRGAIASLPPVAAGEDADARAAS